MKKIKVIILKSIAGLAEPLYEQKEFGYQINQIVSIHPRLARYWIASKIARLAQPLALQLAEEDSKPKKSANQIRLKTAVQLRKLDENSRRRAMKKLKRLRSLTSQMAIQMQR